MNEGKKLECLGATPITEEERRSGLMIKVSYSPAGALVDIVSPADRQSVDLLLTAASAVIVAMALQLEQWGSVCHAQCAFLSMMKETSENLKSTAPEVWGRYRDLVLQEAANELQQAEAEPGAKDQVDPTKPKRTFH